MKRINKSLLVVAMGVFIANQAWAEGIRQEILIPDLKTPVMAAKLPTEVKKADLMKQVKVTRITGKIDVTERDPRLVVKHTLSNTGNTDFNVRATMPNVDAKSVTLRKKSQSTVIMEAPIEVKKGRRNLRSMRVAPQLVVDNSLLLEPVSDYAVDLVLPPDAKKIIKSNKKLTAAPKTDGRLSYKWQGKNEYVTPLLVWWTTSSTDLSVTKKVSTDWKNHLLSVSINVKNNGTTPAKGVELTEDFPTQQYAAYARGSQGKFTAYKGGQNDRRLLWKYAMPDLAPGRSTVVKYNLKMDPKLAVAGLHETTAMQGGEPVAVSNELRAVRPSR